MTVHGTLQRSEPKGTSFLPIRNSTKLKNTKLVSMQNNKYTVILCSISKIA